MRQGLILSLEAHFFKALAAWWSAEGLTGNSDTACWAIWGGCYSWKHTQSPPLNSSLFGVGRSTVYECKLPQRSHITHLKPVCLEDKWRFLKTPRAEGDSANRHKRLQQNGFRMKASGHEPLKKLILKHYCVPHWEQSKNNINVIIKCRDTWLFTM